MVLIYRKGKIAYQGIRKFKVGILPGTNKPFGKIGNGVPLEDQEGHVKLKEQYSAGLCISHETQKNGSTG